MIKVGLIGESENDTKAIQHLLNARFPDRVSYQVLLKNLSGDQLNSGKAKRALPIEMDVQRPDILLVMRDADSSPNNVIEIDKKHSWFNNFTSDVRRKKIFLLNIYELEALLLADIETFNEFYNCKVKVKGNVSHQEEPKEFLKKESGKKYRESDCPKLFAALNQEIVVKNCAYFREFITQYALLLEN